MGDEDLGWDYPMVAMTAARLGEPQKAVGVLLKSDGPNNKYTANGHNPQRGDLPVYLPGWHNANWLPTMWPTSGLRHLAVWPC